MEHIIISQHLSLAVKEATFKDCLKSIPVNYCMFTLVDRHCSMGEDLLVLIPTSVMLTAVLEVTQLTYELRLLYLLASLSPAGEEVEQAEIIYNGAPGGGSVGGTVQDESGNTGIYGPTGGTQSSGGTHGYYESGDAFVPIQYAGSGGFGTGGSGSGGGVSRLTCGGGGGAGWYGGGGGISLGGAGGSSYVAPGHLIIENIQNANAGLGMVIITVSTAYPTDSPSFKPSPTPTVEPSIQPSTSPSINPSTSPSITPSALPSVHPTLSPSVKPSVYPSVLPTAIPTLQPTSFPTHLPSAIPTCIPTREPSFNPSALPVLQPSKFPSLAPVSGVPTAFPSTAPSKAIPTVANNSSSNTLSTTNIVIITVVSFISIALLVFVVAFLLGKNLFFVKAAVTDEHVPHML